ncbi:MAG: hypothetical protein PHW02_01010 [bacterium]|nr:hypothetical protein [bacterium]
MTKNYLFLISIILLLSSCSINDVEPNLLRIDNLVIYNKGYSSVSSLVVSRTQAMADSVSDDSDMIVSSYESSSICMLSPSKDTIISKGNAKKTGIVDYGPYKYPYAPTTGYYDMEYPNQNHWYYLQTQDSVYARFLLKSYSADSIVIYIEVLKENGTYFGE